MRRAATVCAVVAIVVAVGAVAPASVVVGPATINWKGVMWAVDVNATAEVDTYGDLHIWVEGDTDDPYADNWNVHADITALGADWIEFSFLDAGMIDGTFPGGPRASVNTVEGTAEYKFQGGIYGYYDAYYVNRSINGTNYWEYPGDRSAGEHTLKVTRTEPQGGGIELWYDGVLMGAYDEDLPTFFQTAYLGVTSDTVSPAGGPAYGVYTDFRYGHTPELSSCAVWSLLGTLGLVFGWWRRRKAA